MKSGTIIRNSIIGVSCGLFISSCCCLGARGINFDMRKAIVDEGINCFSDRATVNSHRGNNKTANDIPYAPLPAGE
jgi:hypothetical protein